MFVGPEVDSDETREFSHLTCSATIVQDRSQTMIVKITSKRQVTLPAHVLNEMGVGPGDTLQIIPGPDGFLLRPRHIDYSRLGTLKGNTPEGRPSFDIHAFRDSPYDPALRD